MKMSIPRPKITLFTSYFLVPTQCDLIDKHPHSATCNTQACSIPTQPGGE